MNLFCFLFFNNNNSDKNHCIFLDLNRLKHFNSKCGELSRFINNIDNADCKVKFINFVKII